MCVCVLRYIPQFICGDLDSAREEVLDFYKKKVSVVAVCSHFYILLVSYWHQYSFPQMQGTTIVRLPDQDSTDFVKTAQHLLTHRKSGGHKVRLGLLPNCQYQS